jgi:hypothetical protein
MWPETELCRSRNRESSTACYRRGAARGRKSPPNPQSKPANRPFPEEQSVLHTGLRARAGVPRARYTSPMPPAPTGDGISDGPTLCLKQSGVRRAIITCPSAQRAGNSSRVVGSEGTKKKRVIFRTAFCSERAGGWPGTWPLNPRPAWASIASLKFLYTLFISHSSGCHIPFIFLC